MAHWLAPEAEVDLDDIWLYVAGESGEMDVATRLIESISSRFVFLADFPYAGRTRDDDFGPGLRSFSVGEYVIAYGIVAEQVWILRVVHGRRHLARLFGSDGLSGS
jgi:toxin ParE1/3/4